VVPAAFHLNNKEAKRELKVNVNNSTLPFCSNPNMLEKADITCRAHETACWLRLGCWGNNSANSHPNPSAFNRRILRACLVPQWSHPPYWPCHQRLAICEWIPAFYTSWQPSHPRRHPTCWASSQGSYTVSRTPCHGAWTPVPLSAHLSTKCECTAPQI